MTLPQAMRELKRQDGVIKELNDRLKRYENPKAGAAGGAPHAKSSPPAGEKKLDTHGKLA